MVETLSPCKKEKQELRIDKEEGEKKDEQQRDNNKALAVQNINEKNNVNVVEKILHTKKNC